MPEKEWLDRVFDGPTDGSVERLIELDEFCGRDEVTLRRLVEVFENPASQLVAYSDASIEQAFWNLGTGPFIAIEDTSIEEPLRYRLIRSFEILFRDFFAIRCSPALGHLSEAGNPLNGSCYMWWDFDCWYCAPAQQDSAHDSIVLPLLRSILTIQNEACQESALHGLGHRYRKNSRDVESIIDEFLARERNLRPELAEYARRARRGSVL
jgi:hypothetical protein